MLSCKQYLAIFTQRSVPCEHIISLQPQRMQRVYS